MYLGTFYLVSLRNSTPCISLNGQRTPDYLIYSGNTWVLCLLSWYDSTGFLLFFRHNFNNCSLNRINHLFYLTISEIYYRILGQSRTSQNGGVDYMDRDIIGSRKKFIPLWKLIKFSIFSILPKKFSSYSLLKIAQVSDY